MIISFIYLIFLIRANSPIIRGTSQPTFMIGKTYEKNSNRDV